MCPNVPCPPCDHHQRTGEMVSVTGSVTLGVTENVTGVTGSVTESVMLGVTVSVTGVTESVTLGVTRSVTVSVTMLLFVAHDH